MQRQVDLTELANIIVIKKISMYESEYDPDIVMLIVAVEEKGETFEDLAGNPEAVDKLGLSIGATPEQVQRRYEEAKKELMP